jgi:hypothetical protein
MTEARTVTGAVLFRVSEYADGTPWISLEPLRHLPELERLLVGFNLSPTVSVERAEGIARYLNANVEDVSLTFLGGATVR